MENTFRLPFAAKKGAPPEKNATLLQLINQDASTIHTIMEKLSESTKVVIPVDAVITPLTDDGQKGEAVLESGSHREAPSPSF